MDRKWRALLIVCVGIFMLLLDITVVNVALPNIQKELTPPLPTSNGSSMPTPFCSPLHAERRHARRLARPQAGLHRRASRLHARLRRSAARPPRRSSSTSRAALQGVGGAAMFAVSLAILSQEFHGRERGTAFGIWGATIGLAVAIGPLVGGLLTEYAGWRWIFFVNLPIGVVCVFGALAYLHESRDERARAASTRSASCSSPEASLRSCSRCCAATTGAGAAARPSASSSPPSCCSPRSSSRAAQAASRCSTCTLFRKPAFAGAQIIAFTISAAMFALFLYLTLYLQNQLHLLAAAGGPALPAALARLVRRRADRGAAVDAHPGAHPPSASACR